MADEWSRQDSNTIAVLLERSDNANKRLEALTVQVEAMRLAIERIQTLDAKNSAELASLQKDLSNSIVQAEENLENVKEDVKVLREDISKIKEEIPFVRFLKSWSSYIGLFILTIIVWAILNMVIKPHSHTSLPLKTPTAVPGMVAPEIHSILNGKPEPEKSQ